MTKKQTTSSTSPGSTARKTATDAPKPDSDSTDHESSTSADESEQPWWHAQFADSENPADVGSAAAEAVRLAAAVASWANDTGLSSRIADVMEQTSGGLRSAVRAATGEANSSKDASAESFTCQSCPVCQGMGMLESVAPDAVPGLATALDALTVALRETVEGLSGRPRSASGFEHIDID